MPDIDFGMNEFITVFAIAAVIIFLIANIIDMRKKRKNEKNRTSDFIETCKLMEAVIRRTSDNPNFDSFKLSEKERQKYDKLALDKTAEDIVKSFNNKHNR